MYVYILCLRISISEEEPGPLRTDTEGKGVTKVSRTFSYIKNKMYKKTRVRKHFLLCQPVKRFKTFFFFYFIISLKAELMHS